MSAIGIVDQGVNSLGNNGRAWIGTDGPYTFTFHNQATNPSPVPVTLILWLFENAQDYQSMFVNVRRPYISVSLPNIGDSVTISLAASQIGAFAALNAEVSVLNQYGQVSNTWGEFQHQAQRQHV